MAEEKKEKKVKGSFWKSKAAIRSYMVFGLPIIGLLGWYAYTVVFELNKPEMEKFEADLAASVKKQYRELHQKAADLGFRVEDYNACQNVIDEYTTPKGWNYSDADINELVGLPKSATKEHVDERCVTFAKAVRKMEKFAHHTSHIPVCGGAVLQANKRGTQRIMADPEGRGALENINTGKNQLIPIKPGKSTVFKLWQIHNMGDGCIIIGMSKSGMFRMSGHIAR